MSFIERVYFFKGWNGKRHFMTAKKLYKRVMKDSESDFNWIASATELVKVCKKRDFPVAYAAEIKVAILKAFTNLENNHSYAYCEPTDEDAVHYCYNSLSGSDEETVNAKKEYFKVMIRQSSLVPSYNYSFYISGATYLRLSEEWRKKKLDEFNPDKEIDFEQLIKELKADFNYTIKIAEDQGAFKEDDEKFHQETLELIKSILEHRKDIIF